MSDFIEYKDLAKVYLEAFELQRKEYLANLKEGEEPFSGGILEWNELQRNLRLKRQL